MKWINYGDVNFIEHGGYLVRHSWSQKTIKRHPSFKWIFDVIVVHPNSGENADKIYAARGIIDLEDSWLEIDRCLEYMGYAELADETLEEIFKVIEPERLAYELVAFHGIHNFDPITYKKTYPNPNEFDDWVVTEKELKKFLRMFKAGSAAGI